MSKSQNQKKRQVSALSQENYKNLLSKIELLELSQINSKTYLDWDFFSNAPDSLGNPSFSISDTSEFSTKNKMYIASSTWTLKAKFEKDEKFFLEISATYNVILSKETDVPKEFWNKYKKASLPLIVYPFCREFVQNTTVRMNIPPLTLPILFR